MSLWSQNLDLEQSVSLTSVEPEVRLVRGIHINEVDRALFVTNSSMDPECGGLQLWRFDLRFDPLSLSNPEKVFQSSPCLGGISGQERFGGRVVQDSGGTLYVSVGDFGNGVSTVREEAAEGEYSTRPETMRDPNTLGSIVAIADNGDQSVISRGHRNPQGLFFDDPSGRLISSEHGPKGGDEVNVIESGNDYGWPDVTYGGPYGGGPQPDSSWNVGRWYGQNHGEYAEPLYSWIPAIAASELMVYRGDAFPAWYGDILVSAFRGDIHRLRVVDDRVVFDEVINIGTRPRDLELGSDGSIVITTDDNRILRISPVA